MKQFKDCPYLKIKEAEEMIEREKQILSYMKSETMKYEDALKKVDIDILYKLEKNHHDGFSWPITSVNDISLESPLAMEKLRYHEEVQKKCQNCPYSKQSCQEVLSLRKSRVSFLRKKITEVTHVYNEVIDLIWAVLNHSIKYVTQKENLLVIFHRGTRLSVVCFNVEQFKPSERGDYTYCLLYRDEKTLEIREEWIPYEYQVESQVLEGTYLSNLNQTLKMIKIYLPNEKIKGFEESIISAIHALIKMLNKKFGRSYGQIQGAYVEIANDLISHQRHLISLMESLGYKALGRTNKQGVFEDKQLLLYLSRPLK